jgi:large subunit ribosomal protein L23
MGIFGKKTTDTEETTQDVAQTKADAQQKVTKKQPKKEVKDTASTADAYGVVVAPIITEKTHSLAAIGQYTFRVDRSTEKKQVKKVIEDMYKVDVRDVRMVVVKPKRRTVKYDRGYQKAYKKAIVTVGKGQHIAVFEGA